MVPLISPHQHIHFLEGQEKQLPKLLGYPGEKINPPGYKCKISDCFNQIKSAGWQSNEQLPMIMDNREIHFIAEGILTPHLRYTLALLVF